jgi:hypothetical protein
LTTESHPTFGRHSLILGIVTCQPLSAHIQGERAVDNQTARQRFPRGRSYPNARDLVWQRDYASGVQREQDHTFSGTKHQRILPLISFLASGYDRLKHAAPTAGHAADRNVLPLYCLRCPTHREATTSDSPREHHEEMKVRHEVIE